MEEESRPPELDPIQREELMYELGSWRNSKTIVEQKYCRKPVTTEAKVVERKRSRLLGGFVPASVHRLQAAPAGGSVNFAPLNDVVEPERTSFLAENKPPPYEMDNTTESYDHVTGRTSFLAENKPPPYEMDNTTESYDRVTGRTSILEENQPPPALPMNSTPPFLIGNVEEPGLIPSMAEDEPPPVNSAPPCRMGNATESYGLVAGRTSIPEENQPPPVPPVNSTSPFLIGNVADPSMAENEPPPANSVPPYQIDNVAPSVQVGSAAEPRMDRSVVENGSALANSAPPSQIDNATDPNDPEAGRNFNVENGPPPVDHSNKFEIMVMLVGLLISGGDAVFAQHNTSEMSSKAKILWYFLLGSTYLGFICYWNSFFIYRFNRRCIAARLLLGTAYVATCSGVLASIGMKISDELKLWVTGFNCITCLLSVIGYVIKKESLMDNAGTNAVSV